MQVNSQTRRDRILRATLIAGGVAGILGVGMGVCKSGGRTRGQIDTCHAKTVGFTVAAGIVGLAMSQPTWDDVPVPDGSR
jgi:hypothetical protein